MTHGHVVSLYCFEHDSSLRFLRGAQKEKKKRKNELLFFQKKTILNHSHVTQLYETRVCLWQACQGNRIGQYGNDYRPAPNANVTDTTCTSAVNDNGHGFCELEFCSFVSKIQGLLLFWNIVMSCDRCHIKNPTYFFQDFFAYIHY